MSKLENLTTKSSRDHTSANDQNSQLVSCWQIMSKYDQLDARTQVEQEITMDLKNALEKRGFTVKHNGTNETHAPAGKSDIEMWDNDAHINIEITKSVKSSQDREWQSIKDHFQETKKANSNKRCFMWFISPETYYRTIGSIKDWNFDHDGDDDQKIIPICFNTLELFLTKLIQTTKDNFPKKQILTIFDNFTNFVDDENVLRHFYEKLFDTDLNLKKEIEIKEEERHQKVVEELIAGFKQLEQKLRDERIALSTNAIKTVIYLVFIKLYEEKKENEEKTKNRFTLSSFKEYQENVRDDRKAIHKLFASIKNDPEIRSSKLLTNDDNLESRVNDNFVIEHFIKPFEQYAFYTTKVDGLGAAYEVLGQLSGKDTRVGQFFTPENVVKFIVKLAELDTEDIVFDPACGTARFLTHAMSDMVDKVRGIRDENTKIKHVKEHQLFGTDDDPTVSKLAKMNMYIQKDGKTNIQDKDGLTQFDKDNQIDVILTNPPLGDLDYWRSIYDDDFRLKRMEIIPKRNLTQEKLEKTINELAKKQTEFGTTTEQNKLKRLQKRIDQLQRTQSELEYKIRNNHSEYKISGKMMKGGALFLNACKYYLKDVRNSSEKPEWRGGKVLIILDEGILNTEQYVPVREFIKKNFYIKAIISLTTDTFVPVSSTTTKTSILYAIKKEDTDAIQTEPTFFAHAEKVGLNTRKHWCPNHLFNGGNDILSKYLEFKKTVFSSYVGNAFDRRKFEQLDFKSGTING